MSAPYTPGFESQQVILYHVCPVCQYQSEEIHHKHHLVNLSYADEIIKYYFKREVNGSAEFTRIDINNITFLVCPRCGVLLAAKICETEEPYKS